jgi:hypothetical protein
VGTRGIAALACCINYQLLLPLAHYQSSNFLITIKLYYAKKLSSWTSEDKRSVTCVKVLIFNSNGRELAEKCDFSSRVVTLQGT